jgi:DNA-binding beta-propeller fold protein YncE
LEVAMATTAFRVGTGKFTYELVPGWAKLPAGWEFKQVAGVAINDRDEVHVFNRSPHPVIVFDRDGNFLRSWGDGHFKSAHGICFARDGSVWLADNVDHTVKHFTADGKPIRVLGTMDKPGQDGEPFNKPTDVSVAPNGDVYVSDGYGNHRVHVFTADGNYKFSWGQRGPVGVGVGDFNTPHNIWVHRDRVYVADRENHRVQIFTLDGKHVETWTDFIQPTDIYIDREETVYVAELRYRVTICDIRGKVLSRWGRFQTKEPGMFWAAHGIWTDSRKDLYVGEVLEGQRIQKFRRVG